LPIFSTILIDFLITTFELIVGEHSGSLGLVIVGSSSGAGISKSDSSWSGGSSGASIF